MGVGRADRRQNAAETNDTVRHSSAQACRRAIARVSSDSLHLRQNKTRFDEKSSNLFLAKNFLERRVRGENLFIKRFSLRLSL